MGQVAQAVPVVLVDRGADQADLREIMGTVVIKDPQKSPTNRHDLQNHNRDRWTDCHDT